MGTGKKVGKPVNKSGVKALQAGEKVIRSSQEKSEVLNDYFTHIGKELGKKFNNSVQVNRLNKHIYRITPCQRNIPYPEINYLEKICDRQKPGKDVEMIT